MLSTMRLGEKIREARKLQGLSQENLANDAGCKQSRISRIENGSEECDYRMLKSIRNALGLKNAPFLEDERVAFHKKLHIWGQLTSSRRFPEADSMKKELEVITKLPFERDMNVLYRVIEAHLFYCKGDCDSAEKALGIAEVSLDITTDENRFQIYHLKGIITRQKYGDLSTALKYYKKAEDLKDIKTETQLPLHVLYYNIAQTYNELGMIFHCTATMERCSSLMAKINEISHVRIYIDSLLGECYLCMEKFEKAGELFGNCLINSKSLDNKFLTGITLVNIGHLHLRMKKHEEALEYFDNAAEYLAEQDRGFLEKIYLRAYCLVEMKSPDAAEFLRNSMGLAKDDRHYKIMLDSLSHVLTIKDDASAEYIMNTAIPHLIGRCKYFDALDYCEILEPVLEKKSRKKALEVAKLARDIHKKMMGSGSGD